MFTSNEIQDRWLDSILDDSSRLKSLQSLDGLQDKEIALFGKVEEGVPKELLNSTVNSLNTQYESMRASGKTQTSAMISLVQKFPYRLLSSKKVST